MALQWPNDPWYAVAIINLIVLAVLWATDVPDLLRDLWITLLIILTVVRSLVVLMRVRARRAAISRSRIAEPEAILPPSVDRERYEASFPVLHYPSAGACGATCLEVCCICLEAQAEGDLHRRLSCGHAFHAACIDAWLFRLRSRPSDDSCPQCRRPIFDVPTDVVVDEMPAPEEPGVRVEGTVISV